MKRIFLLVLSVFLAMTGTAVADETSDLYRRLYFSTTSVSQRLGFMNEIAALNDPSTAPIMAEALADLILESKNIKDPKDRENFETLSRIIVAGLGTFKYSAAASDVFKVQEETANPLLKAETLIALGRMRAVQYAQQISDILRDLNNEPTKDRETGEKIAYGAVLSLEKMRSPLGFTPVFYAIDGWYTKRVKEQAEKSLAAIMDDPTEPILKIIEIDNARRKLYALRHQSKSKASDTNKIIAAAMCLKIGYEQKPRDKAEAMDLTVLRKEAMKNLVVLNAKDDTTVPYLTLAFESYFKNTPDTIQTDEKLAALDALGVCATDSAATLLKDILLLFDRQRMDGVYDDTRDLLTKAALRNAGITKNPIVRPALVAVKANTMWAGGVTLAASEALKKFQ